MSTQKEPTQRRVYVLPTELVERIVAYQNEKGLPSEVEAARRLLDESLKSRDTYRTIIERFVSRLADIRIPAEVAKDVLVGHPLVTSLKFEPDAIEFGLSEGLYVRISDSGTWRVTDDRDDEVDRSPQPKRSTSAPAFESGSMDDDIPF